MLKGEKLKIDISNMLFDTIQEIVTINKNSNDYKNFEFDLITNFFNTMPRLSHSVMVKNPNTGVDGEVTVEGLQNFLG